MPLIPKRIILPRLPEKIRDLDEDLYEYLIALTKQISRAYDDTYRAVKDVEDALP